MSTLLFVYGTLKRAGTNHHFMAGQRFLGLARTAAGYRLYDLGTHPGMVPLAEDRAGVTGEVWSIDTSALEKLDQFEGVGEGLYRREPILLQAPFGDRNVEAYIYVRSVAGLRDIGSTW